MAAAPSPTLSASPPPGWTSPKSGTLPQIAGAGAQAAGATGDATSLAVGSAAAARQRRAQKEAGRRQEFLSGLLNENLQDLTKWHARRPQFEQKRFMRSIDQLYKEYSRVDEGRSPAALAQAREQAKADQIKAQMQAQALAANVAAGSDDDPFERPPTPGRSQQGLGASSSAPSLLGAQQTQPIDVFEQQRRDAVSTRRGRPENTMEAWLEGGSYSTRTSATTAASQHTSLSQLTRTSDGTVYSQPGTMNQLIFRHHKRAFTANIPAKRNENVDQSQAVYLKDGVPNIGFPDQARLKTSYKDTFGYRPLGENVNQAMYGPNIKNEQHPFVARFLENARPEQREQLGGMVRCLEYLRREPVRKNKSLAYNDYDLEHNKRLWVPQKARPLFDPSECNYSQVPLGTLSATAKAGRLKTASSTCGAGWPGSLPGASQQGSPPMTPATVGQTAPEYEYE
eukprot:gnl/TRDRNA2_/TRDRNA2_182937_c0_seq1.p1 gnl/TRDRNA2_/TRDRNA2_182937_c0~~gnl/TRDRNA2_/TRDRNA2_182937_c0_seq1.p1  ORF type:complete len:471 (-),score=71.41 gnl/TRDRNA2_/TRDRNA2_182937_c0_seq1:76-1437(-)